MKPVSTVAFIALLTGLWLVLMGFHTEPWWHVPLIALACYSLGAMVQDSRQRNALDEERRVVREDNDVMRRILDDLGYPIIGRGPDRKER